MAEVLDCEFLDIEDSLNRDYFRVFFRENGSVYSYLFVMELTGQPIPVARTHHGRGKRTFVPGDRLWKDPPDIVFEQAVTL